MARIVFGNVLWLQFVRVGIDIAILSASLILAFALRFDWSIPPEMSARLLLILPYAVGLEYACMTIFRVPRISWRFISLPDAGRFLRAFLASSAVLTAVRYGVPIGVKGSSVASLAIVPFSVIILNAGIALTLTIVARAARRTLFESAEDRRLSSGRPPSLSAKPASTLLLGAGKGGLVTVQELVRSPGLGIVPVGFLDDDPVKTGTTIFGVPVLGRTEDIHDIAAKTGATDALITMDNARGPDIRRLAKLCEAANLRVRIVPGIHEIVGGTVNLSAIREVAIEDLLGRAPVQIESSTLRGALEGEVVMVTGAGGSIGSELCRQIARFSPRTLYLIDNCENNLFHIHRELAGTANVLPYVANVADERRMREIFESVRPAVVLHAAAYKHVPMMELNPGQAVLNNSLGTKVVADLAHEIGAREFVLVSTDKAVRPSSVMGATKRAAELYVQALGAVSGTRFITVRFGNVLGSAGSVVPIFREQIRKGGPVTITDPQMTRYFMTIPEACHLILQAARLGQGGEIFMLDMGEPVRILDLAHDLISLSGLTPGVDIEIVVSGIRPGEKLHEELWTGDEGVAPTEHPSIFVGMGAPRLLSLVAQWYGEIIERVNDSSDSWVRPALCQLIPEAGFEASLPASADREDKAESVQGMAAPSRIPSLVVS